MSPPPWFPPAPPSGRPKAAPILTRLTSIPIRTSMSGKAGSGPSTSGSVSGSSPIKNPGYTVSTRPAGTPSSSRTSSYTASSKTPSSSQTPGYTVSTRPAGTPSSSRTSSYSASSKTPSSAVTPGYTVSTRPAVTPSSSRTPSFTASSKTPSSAVTPGYTVSTRPAGTPSSSRPAGPKPPPPGNKQLFKKSPVKPSPGYRKQVLFGSPYGSDRAVSVPGRSGSVSGSKVPGPSPKVRGDSVTSRPSPYKVPCGTSLMFSRRSELREPKVAPGTYLAHSEYARPEGPVKIAPAGDGTLPLTAANSGSTFPKVLYVHSLPLSVLGASSSTMSSAPPPPPRALHLVQPTVQFPMKFRVTGMPVPPAEAPPSPPPFCQRNLKAQRATTAPPAPRAPAPAPAAGKGQGKVPAPRGVPYRSPAATKAVLRMQKKAQKIEEEKNNSAMRKKLEQLEMRLEKEKNALQERLEKIERLESEVVKVGVEIEEQNEKLRILEDGGVLEVPEPEIEPEPENPESEIAEPEIEPEVEPAPVE